MANTYTPLYNLTKPEVGSDVNAWGAHLNSDLDTIDANMVSRILTSSQSFAGPITLPTDGLNVGSGQLRVLSGNVSASGNLAVSGSATISTTLTVSSNSSLQGTLGVTGATTLSSTLGVTGVTTLAYNGLNVGSGQLNCTGGNVTMSGALTVTGNISGPVTASSINASTTLTVTGATQLNSTLSVAGASTLTGNLSITNGANERTISLGNSGGYFFGNPSQAGWKNNVGTGLIYWDFSGNFTAAANITAYSDAKLKKNVETIPDPMALVRKMRGVFYDRIEDNKAGVGVIAQEIQQVLPQVVQTNDGTLSVAYGNISGVLIEALKDIDARLAKLETR